MVWPKQDFSSEEDFSCTALENYKGNIVAYVGEDANGCCASRRFFHLLKTKGFQEIDIGDAHWIPTWAVVSDTLTIYKKVNSNNSLADEKKD